MMRAGNPAEIRVQRPRMIQSESTMSGIGRTPGRNSEWVERQGLAGQEREDDIGMMGERAASMPAEVRGTLRSMADSRAW
jgi:hypothetical protein